MRASHFRRDVAEFLHKKYHVKKNWIFEKIFRDKKVADQRKADFESLTAFIDNPDNIENDWELAALIKVLRFKAYPGRAYKSELYSKLNALVERYETDESYGYHNDSFILNSFIPEVSEDNIYLNELKTFISHHVNPENQACTAINAFKQEPNLFWIDLNNLSEIKEGFIAVKDEETGSIIAQIKKNISDIEIACSKANINLGVFSENDTSLNLNALSINNPCGHVVFNGHLSVNNNLNVLGGQEIIFLNESDIHANNTNLVCDRALLNGHIKTEQNLHIKSNDFIVNGNLEAQTINTNVENTSTIYSNATLSANSVYLSGNKAWCAGHINANSIRTEFDRHFVFGIVDNEKHHIKNLVNLLSKGRALLNANTIDITAGAFINLGGSIKSDNCSITSLADIDVAGFNLAWHKVHNNIIRANLGINLPNPETLFRLIDDLTNLDYKSISKVTNNDKLTAEGLALLMDILQFIFSKIGKRAGIIPNLIWSTVSLLLHTPEIAKQINYLYKNHDQICLRHLIPLIVTAEHVLNDTFKKQMVSDTPLPATNNVNNREFLVGLGEKSLNHLLPSKEENSMVEVSGPSITISGNDAHRSILHKDSANIKVAKQVSDDFVLAQYDANLTVAENTTQSGQRLDLNSAFIDTDNLQQDIDVVNQSKHSSVQSQTQNIKTDHLDQRGYWYAKEGRVEVGTHESGGTFIQEGGSYTSNYTTNNGEMHFSNTDVSVGELKNNGSYYEANSTANIRAVNLNESSITKLDETKVQSEYVHQKGELIAEKSQLLTDEWQATKESNTELHESNLKTASIYQEGSLRLDNSKIESVEAIVTGATTTKNSTQLVAENMQYYNNTNIEDGQLELEATELKFNKDTKISGNTLYLNSSDPDIKEGSVHVKNLATKFDDISDQDQFIAGTLPYDNISAVERFAYQTSGDIYIKYPIKRDCDIDLWASNISLERYRVPDSRKFFLSTPNKSHPCANSSNPFLSILAIINDDGFYDYKFNHNLDFRADNTINLKANLKSNNLMLKAGNQIVVSQAPFNPSHGPVIKELSVNGHVFDADNIYLEAKHILNQNGRFRAFNDMYLNVEDIGLKNIVGDFIAGNFLYNHAKGPIDHQGLASTGRGIAYAPARVMGGPGKNHADIGILIDTDDRMHLKATDVIAVGSVYLLPQKGFLSEPAITQINIESKNSGVFGICSSNESIIQTKIDPTNIVSSKGDVVISSEKGDVELYATNVLAKKIALMAKGPIKLYDVVGEITQSFSSSGLYHHSSSYSHHQFSCPTQLIAPEGIFIHSREDAIDARGVNIYTPGHLTMAAHTDIDLGLSLLSHQEKFHSNGLNFSFLGCNFSNNTHTAVLSEPLFYDFNHLSNSNNPLEAGINSANLTSDLIDAKTQFDHIFANHDLQSGLAERYLFSQPITTFSWENTHYDSEYQTLGEGGVFAGSADFIAGNDIRFKNGIYVGVVDDANLTAHAFHQYGQLLKSDSTFSSTQLSASVTINGELDFNFNSARSNAHNENYANQKFYVGRNLNVNLDDWEQDAAFTDIGGHIYGNVNHFISIAEFNKNSSHGFGLGLSTSGDISFNFANNLSQTISGPTGIHVHEAINAEPDYPFNIDNVTLIGSAVNSDKKNNLVTQNYTSIGLSEKYQEESLNISTNINKISKLPIFNLSTPPQVALKQFGLFANHANRDELCVADSDVGSELSSNDHLDSKVTHSENIFESENLASDSYLFRRNVNTESMTLGDEFDTTARQAEVTSNSEITNFDTNVQHSGEMADHFWQSLGILNGTVDTLKYPILHPIDTVTSIGQIFLNTGSLAFGADYDHKSNEYFNEMGENIYHTWKLTSNDDPYIRGYAKGIFIGNAASIPLTRGFRVAGEMGELAAANKLFRLKMDPDQALARRELLLKNNVGYNVAPENWFNRYDTIGIKGTFVTDKKAVMDVIGDRPVNKKLNVGLFSGVNQVSFFKSTQLGLGLGLENPYQLNDGFRVSEIKGLQVRNPRSPTADTANSKFLGPGIGLPNGGPELVIDSVPTKSFR